MSFRDELQSICDGTRGAVICSLMGYDGIAIDTATTSAAVDTDLDTLLIEYSNLLGNVRRAAESLDAGEVEELTIRSEKVVVLLRAVNDEYFAALALRPEGLMGQGRFRLRVGIPKLAAELIA